MSVKNQKEVETKIQGVKEIEIIPDIILDTVKPEEKTLNIISNNDLVSKVSDVEIFGEDIWNLLCKASSKNQNWMKSTKVMNVNGGCIIQVTTQNKDNISESVVFVPHNMYKDGKIVGM